MAKIRTLGEAITKVTDLENRQLILERDLKAAKAANIRLRTDLDNIPAGPAGADGSLGLFRQEGSTVDREAQDKLKERLAVNDFLPTGAPDDWRTAMQAAIAEAAATSGGRVWLPREGTRDIDNTGLGGLDWTGDGVWLEGDGATAAVIRNVSTDESPLFNLHSPGQGSLQRCGFRNLKIDSLATAGEVWRPNESGGFSENGISFTRYENLWVIQRNPNKSIFYLNVQDDPGIGGGGMFESQFVNGVYEHGVGSKGTIVPATVPAFDLTASVSLIVLIKWLYLRANNHGSLVPFWRIRCTDDAPGNKKYVHQNEFRGINIELPRRGVIRLEGNTGAIIEDITYYDLGLNGNTHEIDGHLIEVVNGPSTLGNGGRACNYTRIAKVHRNGAGSLGAVAETPVAVTSLTQAAGLATCTTSSPHGFATGERVSIDGALGSSSALSAYAGTKLITVTGASTFTFPIDSGTASPATGTIYASRVGKVATIAQAAGVATLTKVGHGFAVGQRIYVLGADQADYNGRHTVLSAPDADTLTYAVPTATVTPATGSITVGEGALDIRFQSGNELDSIENCGAVGGSDTMEADVCNSSAMVVGHRTDLLAVYRHDLTIGAALELGGGDDDEVSKLAINTVAANRLEPASESCINWGFKGDLDGLAISYGTATTCKIAAGRCRSEDDADTIDSAADITIAIDASGTNGLDTGTIAASTVYDLYLIWKADHSLIKGLLVLAGGSPVMPTDYVYRRRVGSVATYDNGGTPNLIKFTQRGSGRVREIWYDAPETRLRALNAGSVTTGANVSLTPWVPPSSRRVTLLAGFVGATAGNRMQVYPPITGFVSDWAHLVCQVATIEVREQMRMLMSSALNVRYAVTDAADDAFLYVLAYEDSL